MLHKNDVARHVRRFTAEFIALSSQAAGDASRPVGALSTGAGGAYLSYLFKASIDEVTIDRQPKPAYSKPLHTVAEHEIRQIMRLMKLDMRDSDAPADF